MNDQAVSVNPFQKLRNYQGNEDFYNRVHNRMHEFPSFTPLQKKAFLQDEDFWDVNKSLMIQGATSSGKTLIAEVAMNQCKVQQNKSIIYLAPLRLMVSEKYKQFQNDFSDAEVFASSRDYQVYDTRVFEGDYSVAVIVYEKFYALISQKNSKSMLENCGLIVLDEIQMMGERERGMKIIMSMILAHQINPDIRIIGLTTTYSNVQQISDWFRDNLGKSMKSINNPLNSLPLEEMVVDYSGKGNGKYIPSAKDMLRPDKEAFLQEQAERLHSSVRQVAGLPLLPGMEPPSVGSSQDDMRTKKINLLLRVIRMNPGRKILIFCNSRQYCRTLAQEIAHIFPNSAELDWQLMLSLKKEQSGAAQVLRDVLFPKGVAFHHAGLSHSLRSIIEKAFYDTQLNILVATETLAIGVNLPADVIIVYDTKKYNSNGDKVDIDVQTYKNYIGRAGRKLEEKNEVNPRSYLLSLLSLDFPRFWEKYINASVTVIVPYFKNEDLKPIKAIPYFMSILSLNQNGRDTSPLNEDNIKTILKRTLPGVKGIDEFISLLKGEEIGLPYGTVDASKAAQMIKPTKKGATLKKWEKPVSYFELTKFGQDIVPYALDIETCAFIRYYFVDTEEGAMPLSVKAPELDGNRFLLDILFIVCGMKEMHEIRVQNGLKNQNTLMEELRYKRIRNGLLKYFREKLLAEEETWDNSPLKATFYDDINPIEENSEALNDLFNVVILHYWVTGGKLRDFQNNTGIPFELEEGTVERLANMASYLIEAIGTSLLRHPDVSRNELKPSFIKLSNRVNYGCNDECVQVLNCHIPEISRQAVLDAYAESKKTSNYPNLYHFLIDEGQNISAHFTPTQIEELRKALKEKYAKDNKSIYANLRSEEKLPTWAQEYYGNTQRAEQCAAFLQAFSNDLSCPFLCQKVSGEYNMYIADYLNFRVTVIFLNDIPVNEKYNVRSFKDVYEEWLPRHQGKYVLVMNDEHQKQMEFQTLSDAFPACSFSWISPKDFYSLYLYCVPLMTRGMIHPFLYNLYSGSGRITPAAARPVPETTCWADGNGPELFISFVHRSSSQLAAALYDRITASGRRVFLDAIGIRVGDDFPAVLRNAIKSSSVYIMIFDDNYATAESPWSKHEIDSIIVETVNNGQGKLLLPLVCTDGGWRHFEEYKDLMNLNVKRSNIPADLVQASIEEIERFLTC